MQAIRLIYESDALIAVAKPEGISSIAERDKSQPSLHGLLEQSRDEKLWIVHRLDKEVSGVILFARTAACHRELSLAFERREVNKTYLALVHGIVADDQGAIDRGIRQFGSGRMGIDDERGKAASTRYLVRSRHASTTLLEASPLTGRRHQIRVHLYSIGHPLVGDVRYGDIAQQKTYPWLMLHAWKIRLRTDTVALDLEDAAPESFDAVARGMVG